MSKTAIWVLMAIPYSLTHTMRVLLLACTARRLDSWSPSEKEMTEDGQTVTFFRGSATVIFRAGGLLLLLAPSELSAVLACRSKRLESSYDCCPTSCP